MHKRLSVVIPVRDQAFSLGITLHWFAKLLPRNCEVIVIDDGSEEPIAPVVETVRDRIDIALIAQGPMGRAAARNAGWREARGERILFNDADRFPADSDLSPHLEWEGVVAGRVMEFYLSRPATVEDALRNDFGRMVARAREPLFPKLVRETLFSTEGQCETGMPWAAFLTGNVSVSRSALAHVGGFDEAFKTWGVEHFELGYRLARLGLPFAHARSPVNYHIAHGREAGFYQDQTSSSMKYFQSKFDDPILPAFCEFLLGERTLQDVERLAPSPGAWLNRDLPPVLFQGLQSNILAAPGNAGGVEP